MNSLRNYHYSITFYIHKDNSVVYNFFFLNFIYLFIYLFIGHTMRHVDLSSRPWDQTRAPRPHPALEVGNLNHWTAREVPVVCNFYFVSNDFFN